MSQAPFKAPEDLLFLVVDDEQDVRQTIKEYLHSFGYKNVITAPNVAGAISLLDQESVDFVISDWEMPGLSGLELLRHMRESEDYKSAPFIMVTAPISHENLKVERAAVSEVDGYILKPFRANVLKQKIEEVLVQCRARARRGALVVDDDASVRDLVNEMLTQMDLTPIIAAADGEQALELLKQNANQIAIVISDWEMPKVSGIELLQKIRIDRDLNHTPFLMITSQTSIENLKLKKAIDAHVDHYLLKPFKAKDLQDKVRFVLEQTQIKNRVRKKIQDAVKASENADGSIARELYKQALKLDPKSIDAHLGLAWLKLKSSAHPGFDECIQMIKNAIQINPRLDKSYIALAHAFEEGGSLEKAISTLKDAVAKCPPSARLHFEMGRVLLQLYKFGEAAIEARKAIDLYPDFEEAKQLLTEIQSRSQPK